MKHKILIDRVGLRFVVTNRGQGIALKVASTSAGLEGFALTYHRKTRRTNKYSGECDVLGGHCIGELSYFDAAEIMKAFIDKGEVDWAILEERLRLWAEPE